MKKILILLLTSMLLTSCFGKAEVESPEDIVSNIVDINTEVSVEDMPEEEIDETESQDSGSGEITEDNNQDQVVSGSDNDPRVGNTQGEGTNPPETQTPSVETEISSDTQQDIKIFEEELESLFDDIFEASEG